MLYYLQMNPEQQTPSQNSSYDFILATPEPPKKTFSEKLNKKALAIALAIIAALLLVGLISWVDARAKASKAQVARMTSIAQMQTEIIRVANTGLEKTSDEDTRSRAQAIKDTLETSLQSTLQLLEARGTTLDEETLNATADEEIDSTLEKTIEFGQFDRSFGKVLDAQLLDYQQLLVQAEKAGNSEEQSIFQAQYDEANSMLGLVDESQ